MGIFCAGLVLLWGFFYPITDFYNRLFNPAVLRKTDSSQKKLYLTFDDGPDPDNTPMVLSILKKFDVKATFFLVGEKALRFPELVNAIIAEGHEIELHTHYHRHAYLMFYRHSTQTIKKGLTALKQLTGKKPTWLRPPWGALNFFEYLAARRLNLRLVLWTVNARDWLLATTPEKIVATLKKKVKPGAIIVLHDSGGEAGAPRNMLQALPEFIQFFKTRGFQYATLSEISGGLK